MMYIGEPVQDGDIVPIELSIAGSGVATISQNDPCGWSVQAFGKTPAIALLIALLRVLEAK